MLVLVDLDDARAVVSVHHKIEAGVSLVAFAAELNGQLAVVAESRRVEEACHALLLPLLALLAALGVGRRNVLGEMLPLRETRSAVRAVEWPFLRVDAGVNHQSRVSSVRLGTYQSHEVSYRYRYRWW